MIVDHWVDGRRDVLKRNIAHAIKGRLDEKRRGYAWLSERLLLRTICRCGWSEGNDIIRELVADGEFYRVTARGRGQGKGRTFYFYGWAHRPVLERELQDNAMPLPAFHALERCLQHFRARVFLRRKNDAPPHRHSLPQEGGTTKKDAREARDRPLRASHDPPGTAINPHVRQRPTSGEPRIQEAGLPRPAEIPEDLRYLYPGRFPDAAKPKRLKGRNGKLEALRDYLPFADQALIDG